MLPDGPARIAGVELRGVYVPCDSLGGDFFDWADAGADGAAVLVADVAGHGVAAAMLTGFVKSAFHSAHVDGYAPARVVERVRDGLRGMDEAAFVTLLCARVDRRRDRLENCSAGHPYGARLAAGRIDMLEPTGPLLTPAFPDVAVESAALPFTGARLLLWTDGVEEAADDQGELFGVERLRECVAGARSDVLGELGAALQRFVGQRPMRDDWTAVLVG
jgi:serine phosphatase RsbU (regulator of sigma subunit)